MSKNKMKTQKEVKQLEDRISELEDCLNEYLEATLSIYSESKELGIVENKASQLLDLG